MTEKLLLFYDNIHDLGGISYKKHILIKTTNNKEIELFLKRVVIQ